MRPIPIMTKKGRLTGYDVEVGRAIAKKLGVEAKFVETPWDALIAGIDAKRYDIGINQRGIARSAGQSAAGALYDPQRFH